jgi:predicted Fe-S protein YdhL (DUF1289 family)
MSQPAPETVASPCRDICQLDDAGICIGCGRTGFEIAEWLQASAQRRRQICALARQRLDGPSEPAQGDEIVDRGPT